MTDAKELAALARDVAEKNRDCRPEYINGAEELLEELADFIESQHAEIERLRAENDILRNDASFETVIALSSVTGDAGEGDR